MTDTRLAELEVCVILKETYELHPELAVHSVVTDE
jgi:hypothetical protein